MKKYIMVFVIACVSVAVSVIVDSVPGGILLLLYLFIGVIGLVCIYKLLKNILS